MRISTLKKRSHFQRVRGGGRWSSEAFVLEGRARPDESVEGPRFGFTVTKKMGGAVVRNRIRRRLRAAIGEVASASAQPRFDYVVVARPPSLDLDFARLCDEMRRAFEQVHSGPGRKRKMPDHTAKGLSQGRGSTSVPVGNAEIADVALGRDEVPLNPSGKHG